MPSTDAYEAVIAFLEGDAGDARDAINDEQAGLMVAGSVYTARDPSGRAARREKAHPVSVEIVPRPAPAPRQIGIGFVERDVVVDLHAILRRKARPEGDAQLDVVEDIQRALLYRYHGRSNLAINGINFRRSRAEAVAIDDTPGSPEVARSVTRATFTHTEAMGANT